MAATPTAVLQPLPPLVFVRQGNIWRSDGTANAPQVLTNLGTFAYGDQPAVSPVDGKIAFVTISAPANETSELATVPTLTYALTVMNADGSEQQTVFEADGVEVALPYWTADGKMLLATLYHGAPIASFSPDGTQIAVMDGSGVYLLQSDGSQVLQLDFQGDSGGLVWVR